MPTIASFVVAVAIIVFLVSRFSIDLGATWQTISHSNPLLYITAVLVHYTTFLFRGARWRMLLRNAGAATEESLPSVTASARLVLMGWMASSVTWFRMGDAYRAYAYTEESGASLARTGGTILAERVMDVLLVFLLLLTGILLLYLDTDLRPSQTLILVGLALSVLSLGALLVMRFFWKPLTRVLPRRLQRAYISFHLGTMRSFRALPLVMLLGLLGWLSEVGRLYFVVKATGLEVGFGLIMFVMVANALLSAVPLTPGGLGIVEAGIGGLLALAVSAEEAVSIALLDRSISYLSVVIFGIVALVYHQRVALRRSRGA
ncbi:MAG: flippase-like domain-containing protein [Chloroflexi bacterium]|nr:flippase-like domain-containing protein [Chloroflexota bacterium]